MRKEYKTKSESDGNVFTLQLNEKKLLGVLLAVLGVVGGTNLTTANFTSSDTTKLESIVGDAVGEVTQKIEEVDKRLTATENRVIQSSEKVERAVEKNGIDVRRIDMENVRRDMEHTSYNKRMQKVEDSQMEQMSVLNQINDKLDK